MFVFEGFLNSESCSGWLSIADRSLKALSYLIMNGRGIERSSKHSEAHNVAVCMSSPWQRPDLPHKLSLSTYSRRNLATLTIKCYGNAGSNPTKGQSSVKILLGRLYSTRGEADGIKSENVCSDTER